MNSLFKKYSVTLFSALILIIYIPITSAKVHAPATKNNRLISTAKSNALNAEIIYAKMNLQEMGLSEEAFNYAFQGYEYLLSQNKLENEDILTVLDFGLPSSAKRLFVIDLKNQKVLYNTYVAHGRNSGKEYASQFSNEPESFKSSLGFFITKGTYFGAHGFSLQLEGEEKGINDNALSRAIVMHSADYVNKNLIKQQGYIGRSLGCPALPKELYKPIIEKIKDGSCLFIYSPNQGYATHSKILQLAYSSIQNSNDSLL
ncbi:MAG: murein L,D-transpeptidase catalytic domain family protein [Ginsengibacter sp.]|jgi:hypothetical protein